MLKCQLDTSAYLSPYSAKFNCYLDWWEWLVEMVSLVLNDGNLVINLNKAKSEKVKPVSILYSSVCVCMHVLPCTTFSSV